jgi:hypothetical protein
MTHTERIARFTRISTALALQSDQQLTRLVETAEQLASGIGGTTLAIELDGCEVFAKRVRLTDLERRSENRMSTENIFQLPSFCQRNVGSVGFGVWRELAANSMTTGWVLSQQLETFPLMYHWRVLEGVASAGAASLPNELADIDGMAGYWGGSESMRQRLEALADATASVVIFLASIGGRPRGDGIGLRNGRARLDGRRSSDELARAAARRCSLRQHPHGRAQALLCRSWAGHVRALRADAG